MGTNTSRTTSSGWRAFVTRDQLAFDRADYLGAKIILGITVAGSILFGVVGPILDAVNNVPLPVAYTAKVTSGIELPRGATHDGWPTVHLLLADATLVERFTQALPQLLFAAMTIAVAWLLYQLLRSTQAGEPFTRRNVMRLNAIALTIGIGGMLTQYAQGFANSAIHTTGRLPDRAGLSFEMTLTPLPLVVMLMVALIAEAFRRGVALRDDVEGLV
ncbi:MAG TPA: DUF2975 domain-containing protein [Dermatophilaceae bacterium]|nr:DUF2975 domain-containing protein [Dermatophilaceae bacterium]